METLKYKYFCIDVIAFFRMHLFYQRRISWFDFDKVSLMICSMKSELHLSHVNQKDFSYEIDLIVFPNNTYFQILGRFLLRKSELICDSKYNQLGETYLLVNFF